MEYHVSKTMKIKIEDIKTLRDRTHVGYVDCKNALLHSDSNIEQALHYLREQGHKIAITKEGRKTDHGVIYSYIHPGNRIGSMVEIRCETDFVAKTEEIMSFAKAVAMQVAAMNPCFISRKDISKTMIEMERLRRFERAKIEGREADAKEVVDAQMERWYSEVCLLEQPFIRDHNVLVKDLLSILVTTVGESCKVTKMQRWEIGIE